MRSPRTGLLTGHGSGGERRGKSRSVRAFHGAAARSDAPPRFPLSARAPGKQQKGGQNVGQLALSATPEQFVARFVPAASTEDLFTLVANPAMSAVLEGTPVQEGHRIPVLTRTGRTPHVEAARWGLVPSWWRQSGVSPVRLPVTMSAVPRERLTTSGWRLLLRRSRCTVPASVLTLNIDPSRGRRAVQFMRRDGGMFAMAGIIDTWSEPATGIRVRSCAIIMTPAIEAVASLTDSMPVILGDRDSESAWLDPELTDMRGIAPYLRPRAWNDVTYWLVTEP